MGVGDADQGGAVVLSHRCSLTPLAAAPLQRVGLQVLTPQQAVLREDHDDVALRDQLLVRRLQVTVQDLRPPLVPEALPQVRQLVPDHPVQRPGVPQNPLVGRDVRLKLAHLLLQLLALQAREAAQAHVQNRLSLELGEAEPVDQSLLRHVVVRGLPDEADHLVDPVHRPQEPLDDVGPRRGLVQPELGPAAHHVAPVAQEEPQDARQGQEPGGLSVQGQIDDAERRLELRALVELAHHEVRVGVPVQLQDDPHPLPVRLVADVLNPVDDLVLGRLHHRFDQRGLVHCVGDLGDDDVHLAAPAVLHVHPAADDDLAATRPVGVVDALPSQYLASRGEVWPRQPLHEVRQAGLLRIDPLLEEPAEDVRHLPQVVRRDVRRHADGDARAPVYQKVGQDGGKGEGLLEGLVEVRPPLHGVLVDVRQHQLAQLVKPGLRVAHGCGPVPVHGPKVALSVHQAVPQAPVLRQAHHGVVDGAVAMGMVLTHRFSDDAGGLFIGGIVAEPQLGHRVEHPALHRLQPVAHVRQGPADDDAHRVVEVAVLDLPHQWQGKDPFPCQRPLDLLFRHKINDLPKALQHSPERRADARSLIRSR